MMGMRMRALTSSLVGLLLAGCTNSRYLFLLPSQAAPSSVPSECEELGPYARVDLERGCQEAEGMFYLCNGDGALEQDAVTCHRDSDGVLWTAWPNVAPDDLWATVGWHSGCPVAAEFFPRCDP